MSVEPLDRARGDGSIEQAQSSSSRTTDPLPAAKRPVSSGFVAGLGVLWALLVIALAVVCIRDALVLFGVMTGEPWITTITDGLDGTTATGWMLAIAVGCLLLGLVLLVVGLKPRRRHGIELEAATGVVVSRSAVRRFAAAAAREVDGVDTASATASRSRVTVDTTVLSSTAADELRGTITRAVEEKLSRIRQPPNVRVRTQSIGVDQ